MPSSKNSIILAATATILFIGLHAQYTIDPNNVPLATRNSWCKSQLATCSLLCLQNSQDGSTTSTNDCNATSLTYSCICSNGITPDVSEYPLTLPYFICTEYGNECADACNGNFICQMGCRTEHPCGTQNQDPTSANTASGSSTSSISAKPTTSSSGSSSGSTSSRNINGTAIAIGVGVGVPVCVIALATLGFYFYRHSKKSREESLRRLDKGNVSQQQDIVQELSDAEKLDVIWEFDDTQIEPVYEIGNRS